MKRALAFFTRQAAATLKHLYFTSMMYAAFNACLRVPITQMHMRQPQSSARQISRLCLLPIAPSILLFHTPNPHFQHVPNAASSRVKNRHATLASACSRRLRRSVSQKNKTLRSGGDRCTNCRPSQVAAGGVEARRESDAG